jgi:hypothetical protein
MPKTMNEQVTEYIDQAPAAQKEIMNFVRSLMHECVPSLVEEYKWSRPVFKTSKDFAYLLSSKSHVTLGFSRNLDKLNDPGNRLEGSGKTMRHIKMKSVSDVSREQLADWITAVTSD